MGLNTNVLENTEVIQNKTQSSKKEFFLDSFVTWEGITDWYNDPKPCVLVRKNRRNFTTSYTTENKWVKGRHVTWEKSLCCWHKPVLLFLCWTTNGVNVSFSRVKGQACLLLLLVFNQLTFLTSLQSFLMTCSKQSRLATTQGLSLMKIPPKNKLAEKSNIQWLKPCTDGTPIFFYSCLSSSFSCVCLWCPLAWQSPRMSNWFLCFGAYVGNRLPKIKEKAKINESGNLKPLLMFPN